MSGRLSGKNVLLTGAAGGQGAAALRLFAHEGARLIATDVHPDGSSLLAMVRDEGADGIYIAADLTIPDERAAVLDRCAGLRPLDVLYSNHGIVLGREFLKTTPEDWARVQAADLESVYFLIQGAVPLMRPGGSIIIVTSAAGLKAQPNMSAYSAMKGALVMLTRALALDLSGLGIRVNAIAPGLIDTPMPRRFAAAFDDPEAVWGRLISTNLLGRAGRPEEVVTLALYLASDESSFTTGAIFSVDGGRTI